MITCDSAVSQPLDPFGGVVDSIAKGNVEVGYLAIIDNVAVRGLVKLVFVVFNMVVQAPDLLLEAMCFGGSLGFMLSDGGEEPIGDGSEDV